MRTIFSHSTGFSELAVDADDQYRVDRIGQLRVFVRAEHHGDVGEPLAPDAPLHRLDHGLLDVLGVDAAVRADAPGEAHREPAAAGAQVGDARAFVDAERIHDRVGLLPPLAIRAFELAELVGRELPRVAALLRPGEARDGDERGQGRQARSARRGHEAIVARQGPRVKSA